MHTQKITSSCTTHLRANRIPSMMLQHRYAQLAKANAITHTHNMRNMRNVLRAVGVEADQRTADEKLQATLSALDSMLPVEPSKQASAPSPSQTTSSAANTASATSSSSGAGPSSSSPWDQLQKAAAVGKPAASGRQSTASFDTVMGFEGFAPEVINGRAAMLGFLAAMVKETHGDSLFSQLMAGGSVPALAVILFVTVASFAPAVMQVPFDKMFGKDKQPTSFGPFTPAAELINGRAAMLGLLTLFFLEGTSGQPFFL